MSIRESARAIAAFLRRNRALLMLLAPVLFGA